MSNDEESARAASKDGEHTAGADLVTAAVAVEVPPIALEIQDLEKQEASGPDEPGAKVAAPAEATVTAAREVVDGSDLVTDAVDAVVALEAVAGSDLVTDAVDVEVAPEQETEKTFKPWHKPRKQYIRQHQWCDELRRLIVELTKTHGATPGHISYLTLPGDELLDIRCLQQVCASKDTRLRYLGFNASRQNTRESDVSQAEVKQLDGIDAPGSRLLHDRVEKIVTDGSMAYLALTANASYDVINLDLCDSVADGPPMKKGSTLEAMQRLLAVQRVRRTDPWLLYLTTRSDGASIDADVWSRLLGLIESNKQKSKEFVTALADLALDIDPKEWLADQARFSPAFTVGLGKWLLGLTTTAKPKWRVRLASVYAYSVRKPLDMLSLSFRFEMIVEAARDEAGLVQAEAGRPPDDESAWGVDIARAASRCSDVDAELAKDETLLRLMTDESAALLASARYSPEMYRKWLEESAPR